VDRAELLRVSLEIAAHEGEILVDPDEDAAAVELAAVATAHDDEGLLVLGTDRVEQFGAVVTTALQSAQMNATAPGSSSSWASSTSGGRTARTLAGSVRYSTVRRSPE